MKSDIKRLSLKLLGLIFATVPVIMATLSYFPLWRKGGAATMLSGFTLLLLLLSVTPLIRILKRWLESPSSTTMWFVIFVSFFILSRIADEMVVISFVGYLGNLIASFIWRFTRESKK